MSKKTPKTLVLLDAHAIIHRAYHALPNFSNSKGEPTGALYGVIAMLLKIIEEFNPDYIAACYDLPGKTFRHEAFTEYKGGRKKTEDALITQLQSSREVIEAFGIPLYDAPGFEADDMLGTIVEQLKDDEDMNIIIASGDMDTVQLVTKKKVQVYTLRKGINDTIIYDEKAVKERFGFGPLLLPDYKGLRGDPSDNIPGVPGIGEKTGTELIATFGTIESLYKKLHEKNGEDFFMSKGVKSRIINLLKEHEESAHFSKTLAIIRRDAPITYHVPEKTWRETMNLETIGAMCARYEFRTLWVRIQNIFDVQETSEGGVSELYQPSPEEVARVGVAVWLLNSDMTNPGLDDILQYAGQRDFKKAEEYILNEIKNQNLTEVYEKIELPLIPLIQKMEERGVLLDVDYFKKLSKEYHKKLDALEKKIYDFAGVEFNIKSPKQLGEVLFDQMGLSVKGLKKTAGGARSTKESELEKLQDEHPIIAEILHYRHFQKMLSTYIDNLPEMVDADKRLHTNLVQTGTTTGRFSSQNPNLQNIPADDEFGKAIRGGFIAPKGYKLVAIDYSQVELRVTAMLSAEPEFTRVFEEGQDIHAAVASRVFGVPQNEVTSEMRRRAKVINFGIIYGMGVTALQVNLKSTRKEAQEFYNQYFESFPGLRAYLDSIKDFAHKHGYTETLFGRKRSFPALNSPIPYLRAAAERMAVNAPIQGTATADIIKIALQQVCEMLEKEKLTKDVFPLLQVHDELLFEIKEEKVEEATEKIVKVMESVLPNSFLKYKTTIPLKVSVGVGDTWAEVK
jgi:DNA polymerase-1